MQPSKSKTGKKLVFTNVYKNKWDYNRIQKKLKISVDELINCSFLKNGVLIGKLLEFLSAPFIEAVRHDSSFYRRRKEGLSIT